MNNILIIEDSKPINKIIAKKISKKGYNVSQAFTLKEAQNFLKEREFDLIILDLHLPDGEGIELLANIQSLTKTKVVVLTSSQDEELRDELFQCGILDYIIKDKNLLYSINEVLKIIDSIVKKEISEILLIDDSKFICQHIKIILEPRNYKVITALNGEIGIKKLEEIDFKLIILDMELPDMHGTEVLEIIRKNPKFIDVPIVVLSGTSTPAIIRNVLKNGANDFLKKPFVTEEFILKIDLWCNYFKKDKELKAKTIELELLNKNLEKMVQEEVEKNIRKDKMMMAQSRQAQMGEMIAMIAHQWRQPLTAISIGLDVIELNAYTEKCDPEEVKQITSSLKNQIQYLSSTINDFRDFFKPQKEKISTNFEIIIDKAINLIKGSLENKGINLKIIKKNIVNFSTFENELVQVVLNIIKNGEDILVEKKVKNPEINIIIDGLSLMIEDNGGGIPDSIIEKVFDPYFSTKDKNGTGLGLYMSKIIIEEHCGGKIYVENTENGARFIIKIEVK